MLFPAKPELKPVWFLKRRGPSKFETPSVPLFNVGHRPDGEAIETLDKAGGDLQV